MNDLWHDIGYAMRKLRAAPAFALAAIVTLALGIGANTAIFSVVNGVLLKPLPFPQPDHLVRVVYTQQGTATPARRWTSSTIERARPSSSGSR